MTLIDLQNRHDVSIGNAARAASIEARVAHTALAKGYAVRASLLSKQANEPHWSKR